MDPDPDSSRRNSSRSENRWNGIINALTFQFQLQKV
jgi:hypothetical protein